MSNCFKIVEAECCFGTPAIPEDLAGLVYWYDKGTLDHISCYVDGRFRVRIMSRLKEHINTEEIQAFWQEMLKRFPDQEEEILSYILCAK